ncbi:hypothetical protein BN871_AL_00150 [Paenibacillus sp. P22]|nr:hypothetical protein BN871_AL_00150 [Paenibacillus sp. P22]
MKLSTMHTRSVQKMKQAALSCRGRAAWLIPQSDLQVLEEGLRSGSIRQGSPDELQGIVQPGRIAADAGYEAAALQAHAFDERAVRDIDAVHMLLVRSILCSRAQGMGVVVFGAERILMGLQREKGVLGSQLVEAGAIHQVDVVLVRDEIENALLDHGHVLPGHGIGRYVGEMDDHSLPIREPAHKLLLGCRHVASGGRAEFAEIGESQGGRRKLGQLGLLLLMVQVSVDAVHDGGDQHDRAQQVKLIIAEEVVHLLRGSRHSLVFSVRLLVVLFPRRRFLVLQDRPVRRIDRLEARRSCRFAVPAAALLAAGPAQQQGVFFLDFFLGSVVGQSQVPVCLLDRIHASPSLSAIDVHSSISSRRYGFPPSSGTRGDGDGARNSKKAARRAARWLGTLHPMLSPVLNGLDDRLQMMSFVGQLIFNPYRHLRINLAVHDLRLFEFLHPIGQHLVAHLRNLFLDFLKPLGPAEQHPDDKARPLFPKQLDSGFVLGTHGGVVHSYHSFLCTHCTI